MGDDDGDVARRPSSDAPVGAQPGHSRGDRGEHTNASYLPGFRLPEQLLATADLEKAVAHAELLIVGVPTTAVRSTLELARAWIHPWIPVVSLAKGLEQESLLRMTQVIADVLPGHPAAALTGPNIAREIMSGQAAASVIATPDLAVARALQHVMRRGVFRIYTNHDVVGCELGGALKNVVAIACGIAARPRRRRQHPLDGDDAGLAELTRLGVAMGGEAVTFAGLAGMGDLVTTCISPHSRNRTVGEQLGAGRTLDEITAAMNMVAEGLKTAVTAHELAERYELDLPVHDAIYRVVTGEMDAGNAYRGLRRPAGHEAEPG